VDGLRSGLREVEAPALSPASPEGRRRQRWRLAASSKWRIDVWRCALAGGDLVAQLAEQAEALGDDVVLVDRFEVLVARAHEMRVAELSELGDDAADHLSRTQSSTKCGLRWAFADDGALAGALHQLVDLRRAHWQAVRPCAATPTSRRVPCAEAAAMP